MSIKEDMYKSTICCIHIWKLWKKWCIYAIKVAVQYRQKRSLALPCTMPKIQYLFNSLQKNRICSVKITIHFSTMYSSPLQFAFTTGCSITEYQCFFKEYKFHILKYLPNISCHNTLFFYAFYYAGIFNVGLLCIFLFVWFCVFFYAHQHTQYLINKALY